MAECATLSRRGRFSLAATEWQEEYCSKGVLLCACFLRSIEGLYYSVFPPDIAIKRWSPVHAVLISVRVEAVYFDTRMLGGALVSLQHAPRLESMVRVLYIRE